MLQAVLTTLGLLCFLMGFKECFFSRLQRHFVRILKEIALNL